MSTHEFQICLAAGGTGGHIVPAIAVAEEFRRKYPQSKITFLGTGKDIENRLVHAAGFNVMHLPSAAISGKGLVGILRSLLILPQGYFACRKIYSELRPDAVVGFGGYPSFLPLFVAHQMGLPTLVQEQNASAGLANKMLAKSAWGVFAVEGVTGFQKGIQATSIMNPVRRKFFDIPSLASHRLGDPGKKQFCILISGGSQGAVSMNTGVLALLPELKQRGVKLIHQTGKVDFERLMTAYQNAGLLGEENGSRVVEFIEHMDQALGEADLIICRAGAMTVAEVSAAGRPAVFVPLVIAKGHQKDNPRFLLEAGAALMVEQGDGYADRLRQVVTDLLDHPERMAEMGQIARSFHVRGRAGAEVLCEAIVNSIARSRSFRNSAARRQAANGSFPVE